MDRYYTVLVVPEKENGVRSFRIPRVAVHAVIIIFAGLLLTASILIFDYVNILQEVYKNKHLSIENRQLKEQIQLFQMKINSLTDDLQRIDVFERKLRVITGIEQADLSKPFEEYRQSLPNSSDKEDDRSSLFEPSDHDREVRNARPDTSKSFDPERAKSPRSSSLDVLQDPLKIQAAPDYKTLRSLYEQKMASEMGHTNVYLFTKEWAELFKQTFQLAGQYAQFDFMFNVTKNFVKDLEVRIHELDQFLLDKDSFLRSTPTLLPSQGWITSYYGPRQSHYAMRIKMHEGLDIGARSGRPIVATADGVVTFAGKKAGFGNFVQIDHGYGVETIYAHAQRVFAQKGQIVRRGDTIASVGSTGYSTGPHVHYEVRVNETPVDPLYFILD